MSHKFLYECFIKRIASIYNGTSPKKKTDLIEMIVYGCMTRTLNKKDLEGIKTKEAKQILNKNNIAIDSLPGYRY